MGLQKIVNKEDVIVTAIFYEIKSLLLLSKTIQHK